MKEILTLLLSCITCRGLGTPLQDCALLSAQGHHTQYQVTDGKELVTSTWDTKKQLKACSVEEDEGTVRSFLAQCSSQDDVLYRSYGSFAEARVACLYFLQSSQAERRTESKDHPARVKRGFTYPGTLWCGAGNIAETESDLGEHRETDLCCRTHDHCEHVIHPLTSKYGHWNIRWHTISYCQCDNQFKECLRKVNDTASRVVGQAFFNVIKVQCFDLAYKEQCEKRTWFGWCEKYVNISVAVPRDSGLYDYGGNLIDKAISKEINTTTSPSADLPAEPPTLGQVMKATEDLLKIMMTISPSSSPEQSKVDDNTPDKGKKDKTKKKQRKNKKGKGLKGKRKNQSKKETVESPAKDIWGDKNVKDDKTIKEEDQSLVILDLETKQDPFNDVLNDDPMRNNDAKTPTPMTSTYIKEEPMAKVTSPPPTLRPCTRKNQRKDRKERKGRRERKRKPKVEPCRPSSTQ